MLCVQGMRVGWLLFCLLPISCVPSPSYVCRIRHKELTRQSRTNRVEGRKERHCLTNKLAL